MGVPVELRVSVVVPLGVVVPLRVSVIDCELDCVCVGVLLGEQTSLRPYMIILA